MSVEKKLRLWQEAGLIDHSVVQRILTYEEKSHNGSRFFYALCGLGGLSIFLGLAAIIGVNWDQIPAAVKLSFHAMINGLVAYAIYRLVSLERYPATVQILVGLLAGLTLTFIILVGQIFQSQEPLWKALVLWMVLVSPMMFYLVRVRRLISLWIIAALATYCSFLTNQWSSMQEMARALSVSLLPFFFIAVGQNNWIRSVREKWGIMISFTGLSLLATTVSVTQVIWRFPHNHIDLQESTIWGSLLITLFVAICLVFARYAGFLLNMLKEIDVFMIISIVVGYLPLLIPHGDWAVIGAATVMIYWAYCGWTALQEGYTSALQLAVTLIAIRLVIVYVEVFGSLLQTGVGLIISGVLLISLVIGTRKIMKHLRVSAGEEL